MLGKLTHHPWHILILMALTLAMVLPGLSGLPVIDRDEARFAQASVQMAQTNDLLKIKFQDEARNKKPAAAYWAQTAMIKIFSRSGERRIWAQRLPSTLAALLTILALYWGSSRLVGRDAAFIACALLAASFIFVFEGHIAKTDAMLCASTTLIFASLARLRVTKGQLEIWAFWAGLGLSIMIKGPIGPTLAVLTLAALWIFERDLAWARPLLHKGAILLFFLIWMPWAIAIYIVTDGAFFIDSLGKDFGGKVVSGQESHGAPPGTHSLAIWLTLWPASLFLPMAIAFARNAIRTKADEAKARTLRYALCWIVPFWILIELMPTKLPHYGLPVFPALCLMMGAAIKSMRQTDSFRKTRIAGGLLFILSTGLILTALIGTQILHGVDEIALLIYVICGLAALLAIFAGAALCKHRIGVSLGAALLSSIILTIGAYGTLLPNLPDFNTSERVATALERFAPGVDSKYIHSPHYTEASLVYHLGTDINVKAGNVDLAIGKLVILDALREETPALKTQLMQSAQSRGLCLKHSEPIAGFNYSKGMPVELLILKAEPC